MGKRGTQLHPDSTTHFPCVGVGDPEGAGAGPTRPGAASPAEEGGHRL